MYPAAWFTCPLLKYLAAYANCLLILARAAEGFGRGLSCKWVWVATRTTSKSNDAEAYDHGEPSLLETKKARSETARKKTQNKQGSVKQTFCENNKESN